MGAMESQITSLTIVYSIGYSGTDERKHQSSASLSFVRGIHRGPVNSPHKGPVTRKMFPVDDVIMTFTTSGTHIGADYVGCVPVISNQHFVDPSSWCKLQGLYWQNEKPSYRQIIQRDRPIRHLIAQWGPCFIVTVGNVLVLKHGIVIISTEPISTTTNIFHHTVTSMSWLKSDDIFCIHVISSSYIVPGIYEHHRERFIPSRAGPVNRLRPIWNGRHFPNDNLNAFSSMKCMNFNWGFTEVCSYGSN